MTKWRAAALLGASAAALVIALIPFSHDGISERQGLSRIARAPSPAAAPRFRPRRDGP